MVIYSGINKYFRYLSGLFILSIFLSDVVRGREFLLGPWQLFAIGSGCGVFFLTLINLKNNKFEKNIIWIGLLFLLTSWLVSLASLNDDQFSTAILLICGFLTGSGCYLFITALVLKKDNETSLLLHSILFLILISPFLIWIYKFYIRLDLWWDEAYTLKVFVFVPLFKTLTYYISTNNHIFLNIINNIYLRIIGIDDFYSLLDKVYQLRLLMLVYSVITLFYMYKIGLRIYKSHITAGTAVVILATTIPFYNFAVQIRGYGLSTMLICMLVYYLWLYENKLSHKYSFTIAFLVFIILFTIPTNLYIVLSIALFYFIKSSIKFIYAKKEGKYFSWFNKQNTEIIDRRNKFIKQNIIPIISIFSGCIIAILFYLPVSDQFFSQAPVVNDASILSFKNFSRTFPIIMKFFLSERWLFLPVILVAFAGITITTIKRKSFILNEKYFFLVFTLIMPFLINQIYGQIPYTRVFVMLSPIFALFIAANIDYVYNIIPENRFLNWLFLPLLALYCYLTFAMGLKQRDQHLLSDIEQGKLSQNMFYNYYQAYYHPRAIINEYSTRLQDKDIPVFVYQWGDTQSTLYYLEHGFVSYHVIEKPEDLAFGENGKSFIFTAFPYQSLNELEQVSPDINCSIANKEIDFLNILLCEKNN